MPTLRKRPVAVRQDSDRLLTMQEAIEYLSNRGFPCRSRNTFYRILEEFELPFMDTNPHGKNRMRRFPVSGLSSFLTKQGLEA